MAIDQFKDIENGSLEDLEKPFIQNAKTVDSEDSPSGAGDGNGSLATVLLSTCVAVCGSFEFGSCECQKSEFKKRNQRKKKKKGCLA